MAVAMHAFVLLYQRTLGKQANPQDFIHKMLLHFFQTGGIHFFFRVFTAQCTSLWGRGALYIIINDEDGQAWCHA